MSQTQVPTTLSGTVIKLSAPSICMDSATHQIHSMLGIFRLKGRDVNVEKALDSVADGLEKISVAGVPVQGTECLYISVYQIVNTNTLVQKLSDDRWVPWPL